MLFPGDPRLAPVLLFSNKAGGLPYVWLKSQYWVDFLAMELPHLTAEDKKILIEGGRVDRFLSIVGPSGAWAQNALSQTNNMRLLVVIWGDQQRKTPAGNNQRIWWEAVPTAYRGPVTIWAREGHITAGGEKIEGHLGSWVVQSNGSGRCSLKDDKRLFTFQVEDLISGELVQLHKMKETV
ncbi:hypothetical protein AYL99_11764 [Fonsecaea erecta]|uniref:Uncharacterized protein n=1 Tax=Fonsecaea erecta TaxID=1367422 RepID=A0A178Z2S7_9EURO|nr:hypothetical protein AYL99_11764 [Fonsecaea erecta]OAP54004.1 hypothetical protein AYL99_11764 [Fonsecaea erecta]